MNNKAKKRNHRSITLKMDWIKLDKLQRALDSGKITKEHERTVKRHARVAIEHFETDGWDLDYNHVIGDLCTDLLGFNPEMLLLAHIARKLPNVIISSSDKDFELTLSNPKRRKVREVAND